MRYSLPQIISFFLWEFDDQFVENMCNAESMKNYFFVNVMWILLIFSILKHFFDFEKYLKYLCEDVKNQERWTQHAFVRTNQTKLYSLFLFFCKIVFLESEFYFILIFGRARDVRE